MPRDICPTLVALILSLWRLECGVGQQPFGQILFVYCVPVIEKWISGDSWFLSLAPGPVGLSSCEAPPLLATLSVTGSPRKEISVSRLSKNGNDAQESGGPWLGGEAWPRPRSGAWRS